jgi:hypothetical protein
VQGTNDCVQVDWNRLPHLTEGCTLPASLYGEHPKDFDTDGRHPKHFDAAGRHPKAVPDVVDPNVVTLNQTVFEYAACGYALGKLIAHEKAATGLVLGALSGTLTHLGE